MTKPSLPPGARRKGRSARPSPIPWIAIVVVVAIASGTMLFVVSKKQQAVGSGANSSGVGGPTSAVPVVAAENAGKVELLVLASPPEAVIELDGTLLSGNPFRATVDRSSEMHKIRVSADGYAAQEKAAVFDQESNTIKFTLEREPPKLGVGVLPKSGSVSSARSTGGPSVGDRLTTDRDPRKTPRTIDDKDPYAP